MKTKKLGIAKKYVKGGETIATINLATGEIKSDNIKFLPYGKKHTWALIMERCFGLKIRMKGEK